MALAPLLVGHRVRSQVESPLIEGILLNRKNEDLERRGFTPVERQRLGPRKARIAHVSLAAIPFCLVTYGA